MNWIMAAAILVGICLFMYALCKVSGQCARHEERQEPKPEVMALTRRSEPPAPPDKSGRMVVTYDSRRRGPYKPGYTEPGRNEPCVCGSGKKYKLCCLDKLDAPVRTKVVDASRRSQ